MSEPNKNPLTFRPWDLLPPDAGGPPPTTPGQQLERQERLDLSDRAIRPWDLLPPDAPDMPIERRRMSTEEFQKRYNLSDRVMGGVAHSLEGIPLVGNLVPRSEMARDFGRTYPGWGALGRFVAGSIPYAAAARGTQRLAAEIQNALRTGGRANRTYPGAGMDITSQALLGGATNVGDRELATALGLADPASRSEQVIRGIIGAGTGTLGPLAVRAWAPSGPGRTLTLDRHGNPTDRQAASEIARELGPDRIREIYKNLTPGATGRARDREFTRLLNYQRRHMRASRTAPFFNDIVAPAFGGLAGHVVSGGNPMAMAMGAAIGYTANRGARKFASSPTGQRYLGRNIHPNLAAELNALGPTLGINLMRPDYSNTQRRRDRLGDRE